MVQNQAQILDSDSDLDLLKPGLNLDLYLDSDLDLPVPRAVTMAVLKAVLWELWVHSWADH